MPTEAPTLRRWAMECAAKADDPNTKPEERRRLLKMREALLDLAKTQDWLDGRKMPPTQQQQQQTAPGARRMPFPPVIEKRVES
jgi:hypothetical protein